MLETAYLLAGIAIGGGAGVIVGRLTSGARKARQEREYWRVSWGEFAERNRLQRRRIAEYVADEQRRLAPLRAANAKRHADAEAARHARMDAAEQRLAMREAAQ